jgi:hypothetical protein
MAETLMHGAASEARVLVHHPTTARPDEKQLAG